MQELSMNILDVAENSVSAGASLITIVLNIDSSKKLLHLCIKDNGCGMSEEVLNKVTDPFCTNRKTRKVGLGLPFLKMAAEMTGGEMQIKSKIGVGTEVMANFTLGNIDLAPLGDIAGSITTLIQCNPKIDFVFSAYSDGDEFVMDTRQLREILGDVSFSEPEIAIWIKDYINENSNEILKRSNIL